MKLSVEQRRILLAHPAGWIASGFGSGLSPVAPGTVGSFVALLPWLGMRELSWPLYFSALVLAFAVGVWTCNWVVHTLHIDDPGVAVWDEFVGQWIALAPLLWLSRTWSWVIVAFILFRIFDIVKPWPVSLADQCVDGGLGVMFDDVLAGIYAALALALVIHFVA